jgi:hypothetical protein
MKQIESFFWGIIAAFGALVIEFIVFFSVSAYTNQSLETSFLQFLAIPQFIIIAVCIEEIFKYIVILKRVEMLSLEKSYIINSLLVGLGFFAAELAFIYMSVALPDWKTLFGIAILHMGTAGIIGHVIAIRNPKKISTAFYALPLAIIFHTSYNFLVLQGDFWANYGIFTIITLLIFTNIINFFRISREIG